jgi:hypothetical protein
VETAELRLENDNVPSFDYVILDTLFELAVELSASQGPLILFLPDAEKVRSASHVSLTHLSLRSSFCNRESVVSSSGASSSGLPSLALLSSAARVAQISPSPQDDSARRGIYRCSSRRHR